MADTGMMSPEQYQQQLATRSSLNSRLQQQSYNYDMGADSTGTDPKKKSQSIALINIGYILILVTGIAGSFIDFFDMDKFVSFLEVFAYVWAPLVVAVGGGRAFKNWTEKKYAGSDQSTAAPTVTLPPQ